MIKVHGQKPMLGIPFFFVGRGEVGGRLKTCLVWSITTYVIISSLRWEKGEGGGGRRLDGSQRLSGGVKYLLLTSAGFQTIPLFGAGQDTYMSNIILFSWSLM